MFVNFLWKTVLAIVFCHPLFYSIAKLELVWHAFVIHFHLGFAFLDIPCATVVSVERRTNSIIAFRWSSSSPDMSFLITVCKQGSSTCSQDTCTNCKSYNATNAGYNITVNSFITLLAGNCFSGMCVSNTGRAATCKCGWWLVSRPTPSLRELVIAQSWLHNNKLVETRSWTRY